MAGASDKARFYLEQSVPELREWERREIFSRDEIAVIASKRSHFEHILNARESNPSDYARYVEYELKVDLLRRKRVKRLGVKTTAHTGQRKIFSILDRGTRKFHGDVGLWIQYIEYARKQKANKKLNRILTDVLRLHPMNSELWIYAARYSMDVLADIAAARSYMQRGLRFCKSSKKMFVEYARLEMTYVAKLDARRKILGLDETHNRKSTKSLENDPEADIIKLGISDIKPSSDSRSNNASLDTSDVIQFGPDQILNGAIPIAIFDAAVKQFPSDESFVGKFFDVFVEFENVSCVRNILQHVVSHQISLSPMSPSTLSCQCRLPIIGIAVDSVEFPAALGETLREIKLSLSEALLPSMLAQMVLLWFLPLADCDGLVPETRKVLANTTRKLYKEIELSSAVN